MQIHYLLKSYSQKYILGEDIERLGQGDVYDTLKTCDTIDVVVDGSLSTLQTALLAMFNIYDREDDMVALKKVPVDMYAIEQQYLGYGKIHGWTYRRCTKEEKGNPVRPILDAKETTSKRYCDDNGVAREIK